MKLASKLLASLVLVYGINAQASSVTYYLDQSNVLADNIAYLQVTISDSATDSDIHFNVQTTSAFSTAPLAHGTNFGIQVFGFNSALTLTSSNIVGLNTDMWTFKPNKNLSDFGQFSITESVQGNNRLDPMTFSIRADNDSIDSYARTYSGAADNTPYFAAHVAGFTSNLTDASGNMVTSAWFAGSDTHLPPSSVPVPAAAWLLGSGLIGMVGIARRKVNVA